MNDRSLTASAGGNARAGLRALVARERTTRTLRALTLADRPAEDPFRVAKAGFGVPRLELDFFATVIRRTLTLADPRLMRRPSPSI